MLDAIDERALVDECRGIDVIGRQVGQGDKQTMQLGHYVAAVPRMNRRFRQLERPQGRIRCELAIRDECSA